MFIVTQLVASVKNADQIIVLDDGRVVGKGSHHELMETCDTYQEIAYSQLSRGELALAITTAASHKTAEKPEGPGEAVQWEGAMARWP